MPNLIWYTGGSPQSDWEFSWIKELLDCTSLHVHVAKNIRSILDQNLLQSHTIIVFSHNANYIQLFAYFESMGIPFVAVHLSDEWLMDDIRCYNYKMCKTIWRNYYRPHCPAKVKFFPLGYKRDFWDNFNPNKINLSQRSNLWSFAGMIKSDRREAIEMMRNKVGEGVVVETGCNFAQPERGLSTRDYRALLLDSHFTLCPVGNYNIDCFRVSEALECGSIPITLNRTNGKTGDVNYWQNLFGSQSLPFVIGNDWGDAARQVKDMNIRNLDSKKKECAEWWQHYKQKLKEEWKEVTCGNF